MRAPQHYASALQLTRRVINCSRLWIRRYCTSRQVRARERWRCRIAAARTVRCLFPSDEGLISLWAIEEAVHAEAAS